MNPIGELRVGPLLFRLRGRVPGAARYPHWAYSDFFSSSGLPGSSQTLAELPVDVIPAGRAIPAGTPLYRSGKNWAVWSTEDALTFCAGFEGRDVARWVCRIGRGMNRAELFVDGDSFDAPLRYPLDQVLSWGLLARCGGVLLHAAAVARDGRGWVLAGRSGAGKSTLSGLCHAEGWSILNDDRVIVYWRDGQLVAAGTPWHGSGCFAENLEVAVQGVCLLRQAASDRVEALSAREARLALLDVAAVPWFEEEWSRGALAAIDRVASGASCRRFHFTRSSAAVGMLE